jgi:hypothetical protein
MNLPEYSTPFLTGSPVRDRHRSHAARRHRRGLVRLLQTCTAIQFQLEIAL